jgi:hypothetical protein
VTFFAESVLMKIFFSVKDLFKSILTGSKSTPPESVQIAFHQKFKEAAAVEWHLEGKYFESIFVYQGKETICRFDKNSIWIDTRINQSLEEIGSTVTNKLQSLGEIMSSIRIEKPGTVLFEFVIRDKDMNRQIYFTNTSGEIVEQRGFNSVYDLF